MKEYFPSMCAFIDDVRWKAGRTDWYTLIGCTTLLHGCGRQNKQPFIDGGEEKVGVALSMHALCWLLSALCRQSRRDKEEEMVVEANSSFFSSPLACSPIKQKKTKETHITITGICKFATKLIK